MKKIIIVLFLFTLFFLLTQGDQEFIIPDNAIRLRVIANSNTFEDQATKMEIKNNIETILKDDLLTKENKNEVGQLIHQKKAEIETMIKNYEIPYKINYGSNYFPEKTYKGVKYEAGNYESLVVTLGQGSGDNWWCVLFPPLCLMEASKEDVDDVEYEFFVKNIFDKYM